MKTLFLGSCDLGKIPNDRKTFLKPFHMDGLLVGKISFRDDDRSKWRSFRENNSSEVTNLQKFLKEVGFMPNSKIDGIFGYITQAAVRLFQEYMRTVEGVANIKPDGIVGKTTQKHIKRWETENLICLWHNNPTDYYTDWFNLLEKAKTHYTTNPGPILRHINGLNKTFATKKVNDWSFKTNEVHLIGVRRKETQRANVRKNDDLFFLLINGMVFTFWGSTDPSVAMAHRDDEAFLVEGQHKYRFGWHKIFNEKKIYRALKPFGKHGVLVIRDWDNDNALTNEDLKVEDQFGNLKGIHVNNSINIHWSGIGSTNFSAGCQVIAGKSYLNHKKELQDCSKFASRSYSGLNDRDKKTKGAYNMLADLILCYAKPNTNHILFTLGREESLKLDDKFGANFATRVFESVTKIGN